MAPYEEVTAGSLESQQYNCIPHPNPSNGVGKIQGKLHVLITEVELVFMGGGSYVVTSLISFTLVGGGVWL